MTLHASQRRRPGGFTLAELCVLIAVVVVLASLMVPALRRSRAASRTGACQSNMQAISLALNQYLNDSGGALPQVFLPIGGRNRLVGELFGGKRGTLHAFSIDEWGADKRPLNAYVAPTVAPGGEDVPVFHSPADSGANLPGVGQVRCVYDLLGTSYVLNTHSLEGEDSSTLVPQGGGRMPPVSRPALTWMLASHPIYNYQQGGDRAERWYGSSAVRANIVHVDMHLASVPVDVPEGVVNTTEFYSFLP